MRSVIVVAAAVVLLAGCSSSSSGTDSSGGALASTASSGATPSSANRPEGAFALVGQDLGKEGAQVILDAAVTDTDLAFGFRGKDLASADAAIWKGTAIN
jgi:uncharacterized protein YceK